MRAGQLNVLFDVLESGKVTDDLWGRIAKARAFGAQNGLRADAATEIVTRPCPDVLPGYYLRDGHRLWVVDSVRSDRQQGSITAFELTGPAATYQPQLGDPYPLRTWLTLNAPYVDDSGVVDYRHTIDVLNIELRAQPALGDQITLGNTVWTINGQADGGDDGIVKKLLVRRCSRSASTTSKTPTRVWIASPVLRCAA